MELYRDGIITRDDTGGVDLAPGNADAVFEMIEQVAANTGFG